MINSPLEKSDESLKQLTKDWWTKHSQDYMPEGRATHTGAKIELPDKDFLGYLADIDHNFKEQAYFAQERQTPFFSNLIPIYKLKGRKVLEIGCGLGAHCEVLCRSGAQVDAIDISPTSVAVTQRRLKLKHLQANVRVADAEKLPYPDNSFDYIWSWGVIHHSPNTLACANEMTRVLKPGGELGIMLYNKRSFYNWMNIVFRYGILQAKLFTMSITDLRNRYTDGKHLGGAPIAKYYSNKQINHLFSKLEIINQTAFEQKKAISFLIPIRWRRKFESMIPDKLYTFLFKRYGFMLFTQAKKPKR